MSPADVVGLLAPLEGELQLAKLHLDLRGEVDVRGVERDEGNPVLGEGHRLPDDTSLGILLVRAQQTTGNA